jgi:hypothetical protein
MGTGGHAKYIVREYPVKVLRAIELLCEAVRRYSPLALALRQRWWRALLDRILESCCLVWDRMGSASEAKKSVMQKNSGGLVVNTNRQDFIAY